jgi:hypothetical protein
MLVSSAAIWRESGDRTDPHPCRRWALLGCWRSGSPSWERCSPRRCSSTRIGPANNTGAATSPTGRVQDRREREPGDGTESPTKSRSAASRPLNRHQREAHEGRSEPESSIIGSTPTAHWSSCKLIRQKKRRYAALLQSPLTDSNRRPLLTMEDSRCECRGPQSRSRSCFPCILCCSGAKHRLPRSPPSCPQDPRTVPRTHPQRRLSHLAGHAPRGARKTRSLRAQLFRRREAKYRDDALESIIKVGSRLKRANDDRVKTRPPSRSSPRASPGICISLPC